MYLIFFRLYLGPNPCYFILKHYCNCIFFNQWNSFWVFFFFGNFCFFNEWFFQLYPHRYLLMRYFFFLKKKKKESQISRIALLTSRYIKEPNNDFFHIFLFLFFSTPFPSHIKIYQKNQIMPSFTFSSFFLPHPFSRGF